MFTKTNNNANTSPFLSFNYLNNNKCNAPSKYIFVAIIIVEIIGIIITSLSGIFIFGPISSIGFNVSLALGVLSTLVASVGSIALTIQNCKNLAKNRTQNNFVQQSPLDSNSETSNSKFSNVSIVNSLPLQNVERETNPLNEAPSLSDRPPMASTFPFFDLPRDMQNYILNSTYSKDLTNFGSTCSVSQSLMRSAMVVKAESFGYEGLDFNEAKKYLKDLFAILTSLVDNKIIEFKGADPEDILTYLRSSNTEFIYNLFYKIYIIEASLHIAEIEILSKLFLHLMQSKVIQVSSNGLKSGIALTRAAGSGAKNTVTLLLALGAHPNRPKLNLPLHAAAKKGFTSIVTILINAGAKVNKRLSLRSPLHSALMANQDKEDICGTVETLLKKGANPNALFRVMFPLQQAARNHNSKLVKLLLEHGSAVNARFAGASSALCCVFEGINADTSEEEILNKVKILLEYGADPNLPTDTGSFPIHFAAQQGLEKVVQVLLNYGARINEQSQMGITPLCFALGAGSIKKPQHKILATVQLLLEKGANLNIAFGNQNVLPIHLAAMFGFDEIIIMLFNHKVNINALDGLGRTAAFYANMQKRESTIQLLSALGK